MTDPTHLRRPPPDRLPARTAWAWNVLPLDDAKGRWRIGVAPDADPEQRANLEVLLGAPVDAVVMSPDDIRIGLAALYGLAADSLEDVPVDDGAADVLEAGDDSAMARVVNELILRAQAERATDIHIEPGEGGAVVRLRIDGLLRPLAVPPTLAAHLPRLASRIKVMSGMNIAEKRLPQDGRLRFDSADASLDVRVSTIPTIHGETIDLRLLPRRQSALALEDLGLSDVLLRDILALLRRPNGIFLVTGPTGHGKTTTLYACLARLNTPERKIVTIEDPVEVRLPGAHQIQAHAAIGLTFAASLRAVLRQDPDILMVGEIRDRETAEIAIRASLTGHLVFSTLHTNDAASAVTRLLDMGVDPYLVASSVNAVLSQRLVRLRCAACSGVGCPDCRDTGFRGRTGLFELLPLTDAQRALILGGASARDLRRAATAAGVLTLFDDGRRKAEAGRTTLDEVRRVAEEGA